MCSGQHGITTEENKKKISFGITEFICEFNKSRLLILIDSFNNSRDKTLRKMIFRSLGTSLKSSLSLIVF